MKAKKPMFGKSEAKNDKANMKPSMKKKGKGKAPHSLRGVPI